MKKALFVSLLLVFLFFVSGCFKINNPPVVSLTGSVSEGQEIAPMTLVTFEWEVTDFDDTNVAAEFKLYKNGAEVLSVTDGKKAFYALDQEGKYVAEVVATDSMGAQTKKTISFKATNMKRELFQSGAGLMYFDYSDLFEYIEDEVFGMRFYKTASEEIVPAEEVTVRKRLNLLDTNEDGVYDTWEEIPNNRSDLHRYVYLPGYLEVYSTLWVPYGFEYGTDSIRVYYAGVEGPYSGYVLFYPLAEVGFELNTVYARWVEAHVFGNTLNDYGEAYKAFALRERYDSDEKPIISLSTPDGDIGPGDSFTIVVMTENVSSFADLYDVRYIQLSLWNSKGLVLESVEFGNFMSGLKDVGTFKSSDEAVTLYKAFLNGADEAEAADDVFATLTFSVPEDYEGEIIAVGLAYEGYWDTYGFYPDLPNPAFRDVDNGSVDGFIVDHEPIVFLE